MGTTLQSNNINVASRNYSHAESTHATTAVNTDKVLANSENYYGVLAMTLLAGSMVGGLVAYIVLAYNASAFLFALNVGASMLNNVAAIAQLEYKTVLKIFYATTLLNLLILAIIVLA